MSISTCFLWLSKEFPRDSEINLINHSKRVIGVRVIEVLQLG